MLRENVNKVDAMSSILGQFASVVQRCIGIFREINRFVQFQCDGLGNRRLEQTFKECFSAWSNQDDAWVDLVDEVVHHFWHGIQGFIIAMNLFRNTVHLTNTHHFTDVERPRIQGIIHILFLVAILEYMDQGEAAIKYPRVADTQRCLRVSGKHNDLEEVGIDTYHHTLFEMLGNWSFGDYFKKEAIAWAWELLTEVFKLDKDRLYVTIFEGDAAEGLERDMEAYDFWKELIAEDRILLGNKKDNFWEMGDMGPCGPCSEIHYDMRPDSERAVVAGQQLVNADDPQVIEIWNLVFMQFNRLKDGSLVQLPAKHVDTGMGFERLVRCIQGKSSNYDTDVFQPLIQFIAEKSGIVYGADEKTDIAMRVLSDHIRAVSFAIADGQLPSNNKAGYVIRRILRRAVRYAYTFLNFKTPFIHELVPVLAQQFKGVFDELYQQQDFVEKVVLEEEVSFLRTLTAGIQRFENYIETNSNIDGNFAFELFDTFGFPIDLTELLAREKGLSVDMDGFQKALTAQKERSRAATAIDTGDWVLVNEDQESEFVGYDQLTSQTEILKYRKVSAKGKEQYQEQILKAIWEDSVVVTNRTIDVHIRKLREKIGDTYVTTVKGVGYKFELDK
ncbi:UNVERIFIED_CONTAM: alaS [Trichonephila clavipes]